MDKGTLTGMFGTTTLATATHLLQTHATSMDARIVLTHLFAMKIVQMNVVVNLVSHYLANQAFSGIASYANVHQNAQILT
jgi:hypothetical protein